MSENGSSISFVRWTARVVAALGLGFVFLPLIWRWVDKLPSETVEFYVTGVGVPLLTFAGFLAVYLGFLSQERQNTQQEEHFQKDRFESTFFQLLRTHNQIVKDIRIEEARETTENNDPLLADEEELYRDIQPIQIHGRSCFKIFYSDFKELFEDRADHFNVASVYEEWFSSHKPQLNHYFNNLTKIISFVDESDVEDKQFYIDLIIAQMSVPELVLFFYHEAAMRNRKGYVEGVYDLLCKYTFFEQIDPERSLIDEEHANLHPEALGVQR